MCDIAFKDRPKMGGGTALDGVALAPLGRAGSSLPRPHFLKSFACITFLWTLWGAGWARRATKWTGKATAAAAACKCGPAESLIVFVPLSSHTSCASIACGKQRGEAGRVEGGHVSVGEGGEAGGAQAASMADPPLFFFNQDPAPPPACRLPRARRHDGDRGRRR